MACKTIIKNNSPDVAFCPERNLWLGTYAMKDRVYRQKVYVGYPHHSSDQAMEILNKFIIRAVYPHVL
jgi:hypothetical protein